MFIIARTCTVAVQRCVRSATHRSCRNNDCWIQAAGTWSRAAGAHPFSTGLTRVLASRLVSTARPAGAVASLHGFTPCTNVNFAAALEAAAAPPPMGTRGSGAVVDKVAVSRLAQHGVGVSARYGRAVGPRELERVAVNARYLLSLGLSEAQAQAVVEGTQGGLFFSPERVDMALSALEALGLLSQQALECLVAAPSLLSPQPTNMGQVAHVLGSKLDIGREELVGVIARAPGLLARNARTVGSHLTWWREQAGGKEQWRRVSASLQLQPQLLHFTPETIRNKLDALQAQLGASDEVMAVVLPAAVQLLGEGMNVEEAAPPVRDISQLVPGVNITHLFSSDTNAARRASLTGGQA